MVVQAIEEFFWNRTGETYLSYQRYRVVAASCSYWKTKSFL